MADFHARAKAHGAARASRRPGRVMLAVLVLVAVSLPALAPAPVAGSVAPPAGDRPAAEPAPYVPGELLVRFEPGTSASERAAVRSRQDLRKVRDLPVPGLELVQIRGQGRPPLRSGQVGSERAVRYAEPNFVWQPAATPDDPEFDELWGLHNTGQTGGTADADIDAPEAWEVATGSDQIVVGVIDTGVWVDHPDLSANVWVNDDEIAGNGVDDDSNGYIDDVHGWDFFNDDSTVFDEADGDDHGTHVAGTIAATAGNGTDVAGVSDAQLMVLKFLGPQGGSTADAVLALDYAIDNGARVANNSWGGGGSSSAMADKIAEADTAGVLFVAAAGNSGTNNNAQPHYPSSYPNPNVISVAATDDDDDLAGFSNYGSTSVDLGAPGASILSTVPRLPKAILVGPDTDASVGYHSAFHSIGIEGVLSDADRDALLGAALSWTGTAADDPVLVVDDDRGATWVDPRSGRMTSVDRAYTEALTRLGQTDITVDTVPTRGSSQRGPTASEMAGNTVIWFTGADYAGTLSSAETADLQTFLSGGGRLLLFGIDIAYDLTNDGAVSNAFLRDWLRADYVADYDLNYRPSGVTGTPYGSVPTLELQTGSTAPGQLYSDALTARSGGVAALRGGPTTWFDGTSMATPHVSGAAAQVLATYPAETHLQARDRILDNGDAIAALDDKTVTGRRLNLAQALDPPDRDVTDPTATITTPADGATYDQDQSVTADYSCTDETGGSGIDACVGDVPNGDPIDTTTLGSHDFTVTATDHAGNTTTATHTYAVGDQVDPTVTINTPADGAAYDQGQVVTADYGCTDETGGSGLDTCVGTIPYGDPVDTSTLGPHEFTVTATDNAGNTTAVTQTYTVTRHRPDNHIRKGSGAWVGNNRYNKTGFEQTRSARVRKGGKIVYYVRVENDGSVTDSFKVKGGRRGHKWAVSYFAGTKNISKGVKAGSYRVKNLAPGARRTIKLVVRPKSPARSGNKKAILIRSTSVAKPTLEDAVKAITKRK